MSWTALVPIKPAAERKTRLAALLEPSERKRLTDAMLAHVVETLHRVSALDRILILSSTRIADLSADWIEDRGQGLNCELLHAAAAINTPLIVIHADMFDLEVADIEALMSAGEEGVAVAPDRHRTGTNALASAKPGDLAFRFGPDSFRAHCALAGEGLRVVDRPGLANDVDMPEDLPAEWATETARRKLRRTR
jgi:2-phospho-L-lactate guanylyltransferase